MSDTAKFISVSLDGTRSYGRSPSGCAYAHVHPARSASRCTLSPRGSSGTAWPIARYPVGLAATQISHADDDDDDASTEASSAEVWAYTSSADGAAPERAWQECNHPSYQHAGDVVSVAFTPDGQHIISADVGPSLSVDGGCIKVWTARLADAQNRLVHSTSEPGMSVCVVVATGDGRVLSGGREKVMDADGPGYALGGVVRVWGSSVAERPPRRRRRRPLWSLRRPSSLEPHRHTVQALAVLPDSQHALSGSDDKIINMFRIDDGVVMHRINTADIPATIASIALMPDGRRFVCAMATRVVRSEARMPTSVRLAKVYDGNKAL